MQPFVGVAVHSHVEGFGKIIGAGRIILWLMSAMIPVSNLRAAIDVSIGLSFTGTTNSSVEPADTNGAIGPNHFVEFLNGTFSVYNRTNGARLQTSTDLTFWRNAGLTFGFGVDVTDPRVLFDPQVGRWFAVQIDFDFNSADNRFLLAISKTSDPTAGWRALAFVGDPVGGDDVDFPTLGIDANGVYLGADMFEPGGNVFDGVMLVSIPKADLLGTTPTIANRKSFGILSLATYGFTPQPVVNFGAATPGGAVVIATEDDGSTFLPLNSLKRVTIQNGGGPGASLGPASTISVNPYLIPINPPQPDGSDNLDDGDVRFGAMCYQVGNTIYAVHCVDVGTSNSPLAALRWYKINATNSTVLQSGTISNSSVHYIYPSIAANSNGVVVIGFNGCGTNTFISSYAVAGETTGGVTTFGSPRLLKAGTASYQTSPSDVSRWGDYCTTSPDPNDPNHFWTIQTFATGSTTWSTQITELIVTPVVSPTLSIAGSGPNALLSWSTNAIGFNLEFSTNLLAVGGWTNVAISPAVVNGFNTVTSAMTGPEKFFRLKR